DSILIDVAKLISKKIQNHKNLKLYKFPSDTYCVVNTEESRDEFVDLINEIIETIYKNVFIFEHYEIDIRMTAGISFSDKNNKLITADIALQTAKKDHKDYLIFYDELDKFQEYENNMFWTKKLKSAFINDNIEVYFQPLVNNETLNVDKYECLVRLIDEDGKVVNPYFFLDISKRSNQYTKLTKIVIEKSFKKFENLPFEFSVNISYEDIENSSFLDFIKEMLKKYDVKNRVVFEILEDENIKNYNLLISFIDEIKNLGCKVAIDDFGSGYSNFEHLLKMNVDYLKIDASLIKNIAKNENSYKITKTIIEFAKNLNLKTIAEYVENEEIFNIVKNLGADYSQGYYFSAPIAEPNINEFKEKKEK
ncbi:MAG: EAL domain-containing protein, partial [Arcobacter sp.]